MYLYVYVNIYIMVCTSSPFLLGVVEPPTMFSKVGGGLIGRQFLDRFNGKEGVTFSGGGLHFYIKKTKI